MSPAALSAGGAFFAWRGFSVLHLACALTLCAALAYTRSRRGAFAASSAYFLVALWPMVGGAAAFFGPGHRSAAVLLWMAAALLLAGPYAFAWHPAPWARVLRAGAALLVSTVPPLGYIGLASPLAAAGAILPGTAWIGLIGTYLLCLGFTARPLSAFVLVLTLLAWFHRHPATRPAAPSGWEAVNTQWAGSGFHHNPSPEEQFRVMEALQHRTLASRARVLIFPESVVYRWTGAEEAYWQRSFATLKRQGRIVLMGAEVPIARLRNKRLREVQKSFLLPAWNGVIVRGSEQAFYAQRIPVPIGMWGRDVEPYLKGSGTMMVKGQRAGFLICWEQLLVWPVLQTAANRPAVLLALSNLYWAQQTAVPQIQAVLVEAWADLFHVPYLRAVNE